MINTNYIKSINCFDNSNNPKWIVIHETDNYHPSANALNHAKAHVNHHLNTSVHYYVDDHSIYQTLNHSDAAWAIGVNYGYSAVDYQANNINSINIEMCVNDGNDYNLTIKNTVKLTSLLMRELNIDINHVITHYMAKGKDCPHIMRKRNLWDKFINDVKNYDKESLKMYDDQFNKIQNQLDDINDYIDQIMDVTLDKMIYNYNDDNIPPWNKEALNFFIEKKVINGDENGNLNLDDTKLWILTILHRCIKIGII